MNALPKVRLLVMELVDQLARFDERMIACQVVVEATDHGAPFGVRVDLQLPRNDLYGRTNHLAREHHCDVSVALRDAFGSLRRMIQSMRPLH